MKKKLEVLIALVCLFAVFASADEGMWLFNKAPKAKIKAKYGFELTDPWLNHVRLSSVRFNNGGSGSFVSADGLVRQRLVLTDGDVREPAWGPYRQR